MTTSAEGKGTSPRPAFVFIVLLLLVTSSVGFVAMAEPAGQGPVSLLLGVPCQHAIRQPAPNDTILPNGSEVIQYASPVFLLEPGSAVVLCVSYSSFTNYNLPYSQPSASGMGVANWGPGSSEETRGIGAGSWPDVFNVSPGQNASVWYYVTAAASVEGFFGFWVTQSCPGIPFAVGYQASQVNASDFPGLFGVTYGCPAINMDAMVTGYTGGGMTYVTTAETIP